MRSQVRQIYDMEKAAVNWKWKTCADEGAVQESMYQVALKYRTYERVDVIAKEDIVSIAMQSELKKFNRTTKLSVGRNLFDRDFEEQLIGRAVGQAYRYRYGSTEISYTILDAVRLFVPAVSDEMAKAEGIEGVTSERALYAYYRAQNLKEKRLNEFSAFVKDYHSFCEFSICEADLDEMCECEMDRCREISEKMGKVFDDMPEEELSAAVGCKTIPEFKAMIRDYYRTTLRVGLIDAYLSGKDGSCLTYQNIPEHYMAFQNRVLAYSVGERL